MKRRHFLKNSALAGSVLLNAPGLISCMDRRIGSKRTNLVLITSDTTRAQSLGCYGCKHDTMPTVDLMASQGALFQNSYAVCNWTLPSHAAIFTGLFPDRTGVLSNSGFLTEEFPTLAEILHAAGYDCAAFLGVCSLNQPKGIARGFDVIDWKYESDSKIPDLTCQRKSGSYMRNVIQFLRTMRFRKTPFFLWLHSFDPHSPYLPEGEFSTKFLPEGVEPFDLRDKLKGNLDDIEGYRPGFPRDYMLSQYLGELNYWDNNIRKIFEVLHEGDNLEDSLVVFTGDHGENIGEGNVYGHGFINEEVLRTPLIFWHPGMISQSRIDMPVVQTDILPTILSLLNLKTRPAVCEGEDLTAPIQGMNQETENRVLFVINSEYHAAAAIDVKNRMKVRRKLCLDASDTEYPPNEGPDWLTDSIIENDFLWHINRNEMGCRLKYSGRVLLDQPINSVIWTIKYLRCDGNLFYEFYLMKPADDNSFSLDFNLERWNKPDPQDNRFSWFLNPGVFKRRPYFAVTCLNEKNDVLQTSNWMHFQYADEHGILGYEKNEFENRIIDLDEKQEVEWGAPYEPENDPNDLLGKLNTFLNRDLETPRHFKTPLRLPNGMVITEMDNGMDALSPKDIIGIHLSEGNDAFDEDLLEGLRSLGYLM